MKQPTLLFVCQNLRDPGAPKGSCMRRGSGQVLEQLKDLRERLGLKHTLRVMGSTCLGPCESGVNVCVVDERHGATFYGRVDATTAEALVREHVMAGEPGEQLRRHQLPREDLLDLSALEPGPDDSTASRPGEGAT